MKREAGTSNHTSERRTEASGWSQGKAAEEGGRNEPHWLLALLSPEWVQGNLITVAQSGFCLPGRSL